MAVVDVKTVPELTPGGTFNFYGLTITKVVVDAGDYAKEKAALVSGNTLGPIGVKLPRGFVPVSVFPPIGAVVADPVKGEKTYTMDITDVTATEGKVEILILGHY